MIEYIKFNVSAVSDRRSREIDECEYDLSFELYPVDGISSTCTVRERKIIRKYFMFMKKFNEKNFSP